MTEVRSGLMSDNTNNGADENSIASFPLQHEWIVWYNEKPPRGVSQYDFEKSILNMGTFSTIEKFWQHFNNLKPEKLPSFSTLRLFKTGIKPCWEDPANYHGGKWVLNLEKDQTVNIWGKIVLAAVGHSLECSEELCGIVLSIRPDKDTLQIWNRSADPAVYQKITGELHSTLGLDPTEELLYQIHAGSMDFNTNMRNRNSPGTKRRQGGENVNNKRAGHTSGNGFQSPTSAVRSNNNKTKNNFHKGNGNHIKSCSREGNGYTNGQSDTDAVAANGNETRNNAKTPTDGFKAELNEESCMEEDDGLFKDDGKGSLNKSWGDMESDSEEGSDTDSIWGQGTTGKVDWGELAEEDDGDNEPVEHQPADPRVDSTRWGDEMEDWEAENHVESDGFISVGRKRKGDAHGERRSVSHDSLHKTQPASPSPMSEDTYIKRTPSTELRDGYKQRGRRNKSSSSRGKASGGYKDFSRAESLSPRGTKLLEAQRHKRSISSSEQPDLPKGRRLSLSQEASQLNARRKNGGSRPSSPVPSVVKPPPGLKGKVWSPQPQAHTTWAQVTQGKQTLVSPSTPLAKSSLPHQLSSPPHSPAPHISTTKMPTPPPSSTEFSTTGLQIIQIHISHALHEEQLAQLTTECKQVKEDLTPASHVSTLQGAKEHEVPTLASSSLAVAIISDKMETNSASDQPAVLPASQLVDESGLHMPSVLPLDLLTPGGTHATSDTSVAILASPNNGSNATTPRRKEKRKRKRAALKKKKEDPDLRTHWLLLLSLIVLTCSVFCGIIVVHYFDQVNNKGS